MKKVLAFVGVVMAFCFTTAFVSANPNLAETHSHAKLTCELETMEVDNSPQETVSPSFQNQNVTISTDSDGTVRVTQGVEVLRRAWKQRKPGTRQDPTTAQLPGTTWVDNANSDDRTVMNFFEGNRVKISEQSFLNGRLIADGSETYHYSVIDSSTIKVFTRSVTERNEFSDEILEYTLHKSSTTGEFYLTEKSPYNRNRVFEIAEAPEYVSDRNTVLTLLGKARCQLPEELKKIYDKAIDNDDFYVYNKMLDKKFGVQTYYHQYVGENETLLFAVNPFIVSAGNWNSEVNESWMVAYAKKRSWMSAIAVDPQGKVKVYFRIINVR